MKIQSIFWTCLVAFFLASCAQEPSAKAAIGTKKFFDLKSYFEGEVQRLHSKGGAKKLVMTGSKQEEQVLDSIDFKRELGIFSDSDINRPAWSDNYVADTIFNARKQVVRLLIKATDKDLKTRKVEIDFIDNLVSKILIENSTVSSIANSSQVLIYEPSQGYSIESHQKVAMADDQIFKVVVRF